MKKTICILILLSPVVYLLISQSTHYESANINVVSFENKPPVTHVYIENKPVTKKTVEITNAALDSFSTLEKNMSALQTTDKRRLINEINQQLKKYSTSSFDDLSLPERELFLNLQRKKTVLLKSIITENYEGLHL